MIEEREREMRRTGWLKLVWEAIGVRWSYNNGTTNQIPSQYNFKRRSMYFFFFCSFKCCNVLLEWYTEEYFYGIISPACWWWEASLKMKAHHVSKQKGFKFISVMWTESLHSFLKEKNSHALRLLRAFCLQEFQT